MLLYMINPFHKFTKTKLAKKVCFVIVRFCIKLVLLWLNHNCKTTQGLKVQGYMMRYTG